MNDHWHERDRPVCLEGRYQFPNYKTLRDFLDDAAAISERTGLYPDMGFGRDYVNITIRPEEGADELSAQQREFAGQLDALFSSPRFQS